MTRTTSIHALDLRSFFRPLWSVARAHARSAASAASAVVLRDRRVAAARLGAAVQPVVENLEGRTLCAATFTVTNALDSGAGSLRQAIADANNTPNIGGADLIDFDINAAGVQMIKPLSALPAITEAVTIDGYTQDGASANTLDVGNDAKLLIEIDGELAGNDATGLKVGSGSATIRGLVVNRFDGFGIEIGSTTGGSVVEGNFIGTDASGTLARGNGGDGIAINASPGTLIGGNAPASRNVIAGNALAGVAVRGNATATFILGNHIGTDAPADNALANGGDGVLLGDGVTDAALEFNIISGNKKRGVAINGADFVVLQSNNIGVKANGFSGLPNEAGGVLIDNGGSSNTIGAPNQGNNIKNNFGPGVAVVDGSNNSIRGNEMIFNAGLGIDLGNDGVTPNDAGDADAGANGLLNFPTVVSAIADGTNTTVHVSFDGEANSFYILDLYSVFIPDPSLFGEGAKLESGTGFQTNPAGHFEGDVVIPRNLPNLFFTATANRAFNTSEFSPLTMASNAKPGVPTLTIQDLTVTEGDGELEFNVTVALSAPLTSLLQYNFDFFSQTASDNADFFGGGTFSFQPGQTTDTFPVRIVGDNIPELTETFLAGVVPLQSELVNVLTPFSTVTILDDDAPTSTISISDVTKAEGNSGKTQFNFTVTRSSGAGEGSVRFATANGSSIANDLAAQSGTVAFKDGETSKTVTILVNGDAIVESDNTFFVNLSQPTNATIADGKGLGTIKNDDVAAKPRLSINNVVKTEGDGGTKSFTFTVTLDQPSTKTVTVKYATANGSAKTSDNDYVAKSGTLTFSPGQTSKTITITVKGDCKKEDDESFYVNLSQATNADIGDGQGKGEIENDD